MSVVSEKWRDWFASRPQSNLRIKVALARKRSVRESEAVVNRMSMKERLFSEDWDAYSFLLLG
jgi:hypothetical protein